MKFVEGEIVLVKNHPEINTDKETVEILSINESSKSYIVKKTKQCTTLYTAYIINERDLVSPEDWLEENNFYL